MKNTLKTDRLLLKHLNENDKFDSFGVVNLFGKPDTVWWADLLRPINFIEDAQDFIYWHNHNKIGVSLYGVYEKGKPWLIGTIQVKISKYSNISVAEIGYALTYEGRGKGYMTEALNAVCDMLFEMPGMVEIRCFILPFNEKSLGVAERCGFKLIDDVWYNKEVRSRRDYYLDEYVLKRYEYLRRKEGFDYSFIEKINREEDLYEQLAA
jgi:RimJ/RimL family protein N-acetyltransferase